MEAKTERFKSQLTRYRDNKGLWSFRVFWRQDNSELLHIYNLEQLLELKTLVDAALEAVGKEGK